MTTRTFTPSGYTTKSASAEVRRALLDERVEPFRRILGCAGQVEGTALELDADRERGLERVVDRLLGETGGDRALRGDLAGHARRFGEPRLLRDDPGDEPEVERLARRQHASGEDHVHGDRLADGARQPLCPAG